MSRPDFNRLFWVSLLALSFMFTLGQTFSETAQADSMRSSLSVLHGNAKSRKFHNSSCRYYDCKQCTIVFKNREEALKAGFVACKVCDG